MLHGALHRFIALALLHLNSDTNLGPTLGCSTSRAAHNLIPKSAKGRDAESAKDAEVR